ncbi:MAG TPA: hypothetical protein VF004_06760 [Burkholderiales bacterium]
MSLLWPERLTFALEAGEGALQELARKAAALRRRADVTVVLSNHYVRYAVVPGGGAAGAEEEIALARFHFTKIHGERAKEWEVRVSDGLACAIDAALLHEIKAVFKGKARLVSVQPYLMHAYNGARRRIPREGAWLVLAEKGRTCLARLAAHGWAWVHNAPQGDVDELIERERNRSSGEPLPATVLKL